MTLDKYIESKFLGKFANLYLANDSHNTNRRIVHELVYLEDVVINDINDFKFTILKLQIMKYKVHWGSLNYPDPNILNNDLTLNEARLYANDKIGIPAEEISDGHWYCQNESLYCEIIPIQ